MRDAISFVEDTGAFDQFSLDVLDNDILNAADDGIEADFCFHNCRIMRNRLTNTFVALSAQPTLGGPTYFVRNVAYNVAHVAFKLYRGSTGDVIVNNTVVKSGDAFGNYAGRPVSQPVSAQQPVHRRAGRHVRRLRERDGPCVRRSDPRPGQRRRRSRRLRLDHGHVRVQVGRRRHGDGLAGDAGGTTEGARRGADDGGVRQRGGVPSEPAHRCTRAPTCARPAAARGRRRRRHRQPDRRRCGSRTRLGRVRTGCCRPRVRTARSIRGRPRCAWLPKEPGCWRRRWEFVGVDPAEADPVVVHAAVSGGAVYGGFAGDRFARWVGVGCESGMGEPRLSVNVTPSGSSASPKMPSWPWWCMRWWRGQTLIRLGVSVVPPSSPVHDVVDLQRDPRLRGAAGHAAAVVAVF